jgi:hypothetical protein
MELRQLRRVRELHADATISANEVADRLDASWVPILGWAAKWLGATLVVLAPFLHVAMSPLSI